MVDFVSKKNFFEFNREFKKQISEAANIFAPTYVCGFMDTMETDILTPRKMHV